MSDGKSLAEMPDDERREFCRRVLASLSDLIEDEAPEDFCRQVDEILGGCEPFVAFRNTFAATIRETGRLAENAPADLDDERFRGCVERVRRALQK